MSLETEVKIKIDDPEETRRKLRSLGARFISKRGELDIYYDTDDGVVRKSDRVRRLRVQGKEAVLIYKGPRRKKSIKVGVHRRLEIEVQVEDVDKARKILAGWGHRETEKSEKIRETFEYGGVKILLDQIAFLGWFVELEGGEEKISEIAKRIGLDVTKAERRHYGEIFADFCQETRCTFRNEMTFEKEKEWLVKIKRNI